MRLPVTGFMNDHFMPVETSAAAAAESESLYGDDRRAPASAFSSALYPPRFSSPRACALASPKYWTGRGFLGALVRVAHYASRASRS